MISEPLTRQILRRKKKCSSFRDVGEYKCPIKLTGVAKKVREKFRRNPS